MAADVEVHLDTLVADFGGDADFVVEMVRHYRERSTQLVGSLREAFVAHDAAAASRTAHILRGMIGYFDRGAAWETAGAIELTAVADLGAAGELLPRFESLMARLDERLHRDLVSFASAAGKETRGTHEFE